MSEEILTEDVQVDGDPINNTTDVSVGDKADNPKQEMKEVRQMAWVTR